MYAVTNICLYLVCLYRETSVEEWAFDVPTCVVRHFNGLGHDFDASDEAWANPCQASRGRSSGIGPVNDSTGAPRLLIFLYLPSHTVISLSLDS